MSNGLDFLGFSWTLKNHTKPTAVFLGLLWPSTNFKASDTPGLEARVSILPLLHWTKFGEGIASRVLHPHSEYDSRIFENSPSYPPLPAILHYIYKEERSERLDVVCNFVIGWHSHMITDMHCVDAKPTTIKDALKRWEEKHKTNPAEATEVIISFQWPPIEKMDSMLGGLIKCE
uniref:Uncharacterized protein n=1 Tax=Timema douglasi TaxID=61478 RepID=A0A7R8VZR9_TIMDO|nr:unnamed protein product [Timema douglasi]